jgi:hypothetical protein
MELVGTHQLLVCADGVNLPGRNINTVKKSTETLLDTGDEVSLETNAEKFKTSAFGDERRRI